MAEACIDRDRLLTSAGIGHGQREEADSSIKALREEKASLLSTIEAMDASVEVERGEHARLSDSLKAEVGRLTRELLANRRGYTLQVEALEDSLAQVTHEKELLLKGLTYLEVKLKG